MREWLQEPCARQDRSFAPLDSRRRLFTQISSESTAKLEEELSVVPLEVLDEGGGAAPESHDISHLDGGQRWWRWFLLGSSNTEKSLSEEDHGGERASTSTPCWRSIAGTGRRGSASINFEDFFQHNRLGPRLPATGRGGSGTGRGGSASINCQDFFNIFNIIVSILGAGVLGLPYAFRVSGWGVAAVCVNVSAVLTYYCMMHLVNCRDSLLQREGQRHIKTYGDLGDAAFGNWARQFIDIMVLIAQSGACVSYLIFIATNVSSVFTGDAFTSWGAIPFAMGVTVYCFEGFPTTLEFHWAMRERREYPRTLGMAILLITGLYLSFGLFGYFAYGDETQDIITLNLPNDWTAVAVKIGLCLSLFFTIPVLMFPLHEIFEQKLLLNDWFKTQSVLLQTIWCNFLRAFVILVVVTVAIMVPGFGIIISLVGSTVCAMLALVIPSVLHLRVFGNQLTWLTRVGDYALIICGVLFAIYGTYSSVVDIFGPLGGGEALLPPVNLNKHLSIK
ncbi:hypothetical protein R1sor_007372 [Riccia sorocarpa]|uniref:Amino acid transporter transmembrane domain-containing protein n=1 Tax=Riccia sorocarpa TaxID=122646 RepID=A0ABD3HRZ5_9MARC